MAPSPGVEKVQDEAEDGTVRAQDARSDFTALAGLAKASSSAQA